ncbi:inositol-1-monophosphatase [secondary endosymbiont of Trabutina mannipara]|nr:inositol-1-monophosphatase [secondary endosymbiont of Trabutina mannipara]
MHPMLNIAISAARVAGNLIAKFYETPDNDEVNNCFVKKIKKKAEYLIVEVIRKFYPHHTILSEELGELYYCKNTDVQWIITPLSGTNNFIKRFPHFSVSIAVIIKKHTKIAVIYDPIRNELFTAYSGKGTQLNGYRLRGSTARNLNGTILVTGFPFNHKNYNLMNKLLIQCADLRRTGSTALDLAYVAAGRVDGFLEMGLKKWDFTGGELLVRESGSLVTDFTGGPDYIFSGNLIAGNYRIIKAIFNTMHKELMQCVE